jgi:hypothetical protein
LRYRVYLFSIFCESYSMGFFVSNPQWQQRWGKASRKHWWAVGGLFALVLASFSRAPQAATVPAQPCRNAPESISHERGALPHSLPATLVSVHRLLAPSSELQGLLQPADDGWVLPTSSVNSYSSAHWLAGGVTGIAAQAPRSADQPRRVSLGRVQRFELQITTVGSQVSTGVLDQGRLVYPHTFPATDTVLLTSSFAFEELWLLHTASAPHRFHWNITWNHGITEATLDRHQELLFLDARQRPVLRLPRPFALDASGKKRWLQVSWNAPELLMDLDTRGLVYPIVVDPGLVEVASWEQKMPAQHPQGRSGSSMAHDPTAGISVLFGGTFSQSGLSALNAVTYKWDGTNWTNSVSGTPEARMLAGQAYLPSTGIVLWGGQQPGGSNAVDGPWLYRPTMSPAWVPLVVPGTAPAVRGGHAFVVSAGPKITTFGGGLEDMSGAALAGEYTLTNGIGWQNSSSTPFPVLRDHATVAMEGSGDRILVVGGRSCIVQSDVAPCSTPLTEPQMRSGTEVKAVTTGDVPPPGWGMVGTWDSVRKRAVFFGGRNLTTVYGDTYEFDGVRWYRRTGITQPPARSFAAMTYQSTSNDTLLFGGNNSLLEVIANGITTHFDDTWVYKVATSACTVDSQCDTGHCVEGVCCEVAACAPCQSCAMPESPGYCSPISGTSDPKCPSSCSNGVCQGGQGAPCSSASQCTVGTAAGQCVDGHCCTSASCGECQTCAQTGECVAVTNGDDPDSCASTCNSSGQCVKAANGESCVGNTDCTSGFCVDTICCDSACTGECASCGTGSCKPLGAGEMPKKSCPALTLCDGISNACPSNCQSAGCAQGTCSSDGNCKQPNGSICSQATQCESNFCVDGICCGSACDQVCEQCVGAQGAGICQAIPVGQPDTERCDPLVACQQQGGSCPTSCTDNSQCVQDAYCDTKTNQCAAGGPTTVGITCQTDVDCPTPLKCREKKCLFPKLVEPEVCLYPSFHDANGACLKPTETTFTPGTPQSCTCDLPGQSSTNNLPIESSMLLLLAMAALRSRESRRRVEVFLSIAGISVLASCQPTYEMDAHEACRNAGFSIASRTLSCTGNGELANQRYDQLVASYRCSVNEVTIDQFECAEQLNAISCSDALAYGDDLAKWLARSKTCGRILTGGESNPDLPADNPVCYQVFQAVKDRMAGCIESPDFNIPEVPSWEQFSKDYQCLAPLVAANSDSSPLSDCERDILFTMECQPRSFAEWLAAAKGCETVVQKTTSGTQGQGGNP